MATKVGSIYVEVRSDTTKYQKDMTNLRTSATQSGKEVSEALNSAISPTKASAGIRTISTGLTQLAQTAKVPERQFRQTADEISKAFGDVASAIGISEKEFAQLNERMLRNKAFQQSTNDLRNLTRAADLSAKETKTLALQMGYSSKQADKMADKIHRVGKETSALESMMSKAAVAATAAFGIHEFIDYADQIRKAGVELEALEFALTSVGGSTQIARQEMAFINETAKYLGLNLTSMEQSYKSLMAAAKNTALEGQATRDIFKAISTASAVLGLSAEDTGGALYALTQMISKGKVQTEELRRQLGERLPGAFNLAAEAMGVSTAELDKMLEQGQVFADDFLPRFAMVVQERFGDSAEKAGKTARAAFENYGTAVLELKRTISESGVNDFFADLARTATVVMNAASAIIKSSNERSALTVTANESHIKTLDAITKGWGSAAQASGTYDKAVSRINNEHKNLINPSDWRGVRDAIVGFYGESADAAKKSAKVLDEINEYILASEYDKIAKTESKELKSAEKRYLEIKKKAEKAGADLEDIETAYQNEIIKIHQDAQEKRNKIWEKGNKEYEKVISDQIKAEEKLRDYIYASNAQISAEKEKIREDWLKAVDKYIKTEEENELKSIEKKYKAHVAAFGYQEEVYKAYLKAKQALTDDYAEKERKKQEKELKKVQDAYDDLYGDVKNWTRDVIDGWDDMGTTLVDMAENMVKEIAAAFLAQTIVMPVVLSAGSAFGLSQKGIGYSSILDYLGSENGGTDTVGLFGTASSAYNVLSGGLSTSVYNISTTALDAMGFGWESTIAMGETLASLAGPLAIAAAAIPIVMDLMEQSPTPAIGLISETASTPPGEGEINSQTGFDYRVWIQDTEGRTALGDAIAKYFDGQFGVVEEATEFSVAEALRNVEFDRNVELDKFGGDTEAALIELANQVFGSVSGTLVDSLIPDASSVYFDVSFFEGIKEASGYDTLFEAYAEFASVVGKIDNFSTEFADQVYVYGESANSAYENLVTIHTALEDVEAGLSSITNVSSITAVSDLADTWQDLIETLESANATAEQISGTKSAMAHVLGANITGLTADSLASALASGGDIESILETSVTGAVAANIAQIISDSYLTAINKEIGQVWIDSGGDIETTIAALKEIDLTEAQNDINSLADAFGLMTDSASSAESILKDAISAEEDLLNARKDAADSISDLLDSLEVGSAPVQSIEYYSAKYADLLATARTATTADEINDAISELTSFVPDYLDFAEAYGGDYNSLFTQITSDLQSLEDVQLTEAEKQTSELEYINDCLGNIDTTLTSLNSAFAAYQSSTGAYTTPIGWAADDYVSQKADSLGWTDSEVWAAFARDNLTAAEHYDRFGRYEDFYKVPSFDVGGISSGPADGYLIKSHATEAHVPVPSGKIPVELNGSISPNVTVIVQLGNQELKGFVTKIIQGDIRSNPETQSRIRRIAG